MKISATKYVLLIAAVCFGLILSAQKKVANFSFSDTTNPFFTTITYRLACNHALKNQEDSSLLYAQLYLKYAGRTGVVGILASPEMNGHLTGAGWQKMRKELIAQLKTIYSDSLNIPLFLQFIQFESEDQNARWSDFSEKKKGKYHLVEDTLNAKHLKFIDSLINAKVLLNKATVGADGMEALFLIIQHCTDSIRQSSYEPYMQAWLKNGDIAKSSYAYYTDRQRVARGLPQVYGSQFWTDTKTNKLVLYPVEDVAHINERRAAAGLKTIQYYLLNVELIEVKKFRLESVAGMLRGNEDVMEYINRESK